MWHHVEIVLTNVSEERITSIFRVGDKKTRVCCTCSAGWLADFFVHFNDVLCSPHYTASNGRITNELQRIWKEAGIA
jgi:hypothetical protein